MMRCRAQRSSGRPKGGGSRPTLTPATRLPSVCAGWPLALVLVTRCAALLMMPQRDSCLPELACSECCSSWASFHVSRLLTASAMVTAEQGLLPPALEQHVTAIPDVQPPVVPDSRHLCRTTRMASPTTT